MKNFWKIVNTTNQNIKIAVAKSNETTIGVIIKPNEFCISEGRMTSSIDAQERRRFIEIDREYNNSEHNFELAKALQLTQLDIAKKDAQNYIGK